MSATGRDEVAGTVAVIGLGSMGFGMAQSLRRKGLDVVGCDVNAAAVQRFVSEGGRGAATPAEAARGAGSVVSVVVNAAQTETILFGAGGALETLPKGAVVISSATMDPSIARKSPSAWRRRAASISTRPSAAAPLAPPRAS